MNRQTALRHPVSLPIALAVSLALAACGGGGGGGGTDAVSLATDGAAATIGSAASDAGFVSAISQTELTSTTTVPSTEAIVAEPPAASVTQNVASAAANMAGDQAASSGADTSSASAAAAVKATETMKVALAASTGGEIVVQARASLAAGVGAQIEVRVDGQVVGTAEVRTSSFTDFVFPTTLATGASVVDVVYTNDATVAGVDRNLWVRSVTVHGVSHAATGSDMTYDIGAGAAAFDGQNTMPGQEGLFWNGSLRLQTVASTTVTAGEGYFVDQTAGNDSNPGTAAAPFRTLRRLQSVRLLAGQGIFLKCGQIWRESLSLSDTQLVDGGVVAGYGTCSTSSKAVISGADNFSAGWVLSNGVWSRSVPAGTPQITRLTVNGNSLRTARWPNHVEATNSYALTSAGASASNSVVKAAAADLQALQGRDLVGATLHARTSAWMIETRQVSRFDAATGSITLDSMTKYPVDPGEGYVLEGKRWMLDAAGEFFHDTASNTLYVIASDTTTQANLNAAAVEGAVRDTPLTLARRSSLRVADIATRMGRADGLLLQDVPAAVVERVESAFNGRAGITLMQDQTKPGPIVRNSVFTNNWVLGIDAQSTAGAQLLANDITATGTVSSNSWSQAAIAAGPGASVLDNNVDGSAYHGIRFSGSNGSVVRGNTITNYCKRLADCGGIYSWNGNKTIAGQSSLVEANQVLTAKANTDGAAGFGIEVVGGIFLDDFAAGVTVRSNLVYGVPLGIEVHNGWGNTIESNRIWLSTKAALVAAMDQSDKDWMVGNIFRNNQIVPLKTGSAVFPAMPTFQESYPIWFTNNLSGSASITSGSNLFTGNQVVRLDGSLDGVHAWIRSNTEDTKLSSASWALFNPADARTATPLTFAMYTLVLGPELVRGGTFDNGQGAWTTWFGASAAPGSAQASSGGAGCTGTCMRLLPGTSTDYLASPPFSMKANAPHVFSYAARLEQAATLRFPYIGRDASPYDSMATGAFSSSSKLSGVAGEVIRYEGFFTAKASDPARVNLQSKTVGVPVYFDNVSVRELQGFSFSTAADWSALAYAPRSGPRTVSCSNLGWGTNCSATTIDGTPVTLPTTLAAGTQQLYLRADSSWRR